MGTHNSRPIGLRAPPSVLTGAVLAEQEAGPEARAEATAAVRWALTLVGKWT